MAAILMPLLATGAILPANLQCESKPEPLGIDVASPRLSWQVNITAPGERGQSQSAYRILVASSSQLLASNQGDLWDSGQVNTNQSSQIPYGGQALASHKVCYWKVQTWDKASQPSGWSAPASWSMGILTQAEWTASWIGREGAPALSSDTTTFSKANWIWYPEGSPASSAPVATRWFLKTFVVPTGTSVSQAVATMTADDSFTLYVNGQKASSGTAWNVAYSADISSLLVAGTNVLAVAAVNGGTSANPAGLIGAFDLKFSNGQANSFQTDSSWLTANQLFNNWNQTNFIPSGWSSAAVLGAYGMSPWGTFTSSKTYLAATHLRKDFTLSQLPARAVLYVTALGLVEPHLNGSRVGNDYFLPGWTDYTKRVYSRAYDVTSHLQLGGNTLGAILGDGWFRGNISILGQNYYGTKTRLRAQLHLFYADGTKQVIPSDVSWKAGFGPILQSDMQAGEAYDSRIELPGWDSPGYTNAAWGSVATTAEVTPSISAAPAEPVRSSLQIVPIAITQPKPGLYVVNFGQNFAGWARLKITNQPAGSTIVMRFGEWLSPDGTVFRDNLRSAAATDTYICKGDAVETWEPHFTYHGFQYLEVQGLAQPPTLGTFTGMVVHSALPEVGSFQCSDAQINHIASNMLWTVRANYFDIPTDCPQRDERMGWCDGTEVMRSGMFSMQGESFFSKWYQDMVDGKLDATTFPQMAPTPHKNFGFSSGWADCAVLVPYWVYQTYGDTRLASRFYSDMASHLQHYAATAINYIGQSGSYSDWLSVDTSTPGTLVSTAFYAHCADEMAEMAQTLGKPADVVLYRQLFTNICSAFQSNFVTSNGTVGSGSQSGYVLALNFNLLTPAQRTMAAAKLVAAVKAQNGHPSTGMVTTHLLLPTLTSIGHSDLAYQMLAKKDYPSWGYTLGLGATTIWERWNSVNPNGTVNTESMNSLNHANFGTCSEWFYSSILGIDLLEPGFKKILISPQLGGGLTWAHGYYDSIQGRIASSWQITNSQLTLNVTIPANTTAEIHVPSANSSGVLESSQPASLVAGLTFLRYDGKAVIFNAQPGTYSFTSRLANTNTAYLDSFNAADGMALNGRTSVSDGGTGVNAWVASPSLKITNSSAAISGQQSAFLPFSPANGRLYSLSADFNVTSPAPGWFLSLGFTPNTSVGGGNWSGASPVGWMLLNPSGGLQTFTGPGTTGDHYPTSGDYPTGAAPHNLRIDLDTTGGTGNWLFSYYVDGELLHGPVAAPSNPNIHSVSFGGDNTATGTIDNFQLTSAGPFQPTISSLNPAGSLLTVKGFNGPANQAFSILSSTNLSLAKSSWTAVLTDSFDWCGAFSNVMAINPSLSCNFYLIQQ